MLNKNLGIQPQQQQQYHIPTSKEQRQHQLFPLVFTDLAPQIASSLQPVNYLRELLVCGSTHYYGRVAETFICIMPCTVVPYARLGADDS